MKNKINDGGPAFPSRADDLNGDPKTGMTLRDYFAAKVLAGMMADPNLPPKMSASGIAETAYCIADEMLKARETNQ